ncbi:hypothetical protein PIB30_071221 [Stylosanthes scabra]|uniref:RNase H type-1 domain-containing protein n=1 Tax=Stylosanthes scabra TaxID=79078 RepID=A0ABU6YLA5_9FABA|nr:hypothetical protein [Stylosanthes scabra]
MSLLVDWTPLFDSIVKINCDASVYNVSHVNGFAQVHSNSEHAADQWNWSAKLVLIQRTANVAADFLAKSTVDKHIDYVELLKPLNGMHNVLQIAHHSSQKN